MIYTKGKWHIDPLTGEVKANGTQIAKVYGATEFNHTSNADECMANASLILNAPEMYKVLQEIQDWCKDNDITSDIECDIWEVLTRIEEGEHD